MTPSHSFVLHANPDTLVLTLWKIVPLIIIQKTVSGMVLKCYDQERDILKRFII
jgi:hypothetical protein